jgi:GNAT superfamily N-acetyltransferase
MDIVVELAAPITLDAVAPADERALRDWFAVLSVAQAHDVPTDPPPCWMEHRAPLVATDPGYAETAWLARAGAGDTVGVAVLALPTLDNPEVALGELVVSPQHRRRGVGRRLLRQLADTARAAGRVRLIIEAREPLDEPGPAPAFLTAAGAARPSPTSAGGSRYRQPTRRHSRRSPSRRPRPPSGTTSSGGPATHRRNGSTTWRC